MSPDEGWLAVGKYFVGGSWGSSWYVVVSNIFDRSLSSSELKAFMRAATSAYDLGGGSFIPEEQVL